MDPLYHPLSILFQDVHVRSDGRNARAVLLNDQLRKMLDEFHFQRDHFRSVCSYVKAYEPDYWSWLYIRDNYVFGKLPSAS